MLSTLRANSVMQGSIDYFCLACEALLKSDSDVDLHIVLPTHVKCLQQTKYVESCVEDRVREVKKRYYCEFCNILLPYKNKVNLHIKEDKHKFNKTEGGVQKKPPVFLKWVDDAVVAFDDVLISSDAWQGFIDEVTSCIVCEKEISDPEAHRVETDHVIRLMQAKVQGGNDNIYRKIDDTTFQCLTCNVVITSSEIVTHFDTAPHLKLYIERQKAQRALEKSLAARKSDASKIPENKSSAKPEQVSGKNQKSGKKDQEAPKKGQETAKKEEVSKKEAVTPKKETVVPKKETVVPKKETPAQKKEQEATVKKVPLKKNPAPNKEPINVCKALGIRDYINMDADNSGNMCNCILCGWTIERSGVPRHVSGRHHQTILKLQEEREERLRKNKREEYQEEVELEEPETKEEEKEEDSKEKSKIIDSIVHLQKNHVLIDLITEKAFCTKCSLALSYTFEIIEKHILNHDKKTETGEKYPKLSESHVKTDVKKEKKEDKSFEYEQAKRFAAENDLTYNRDNSKAFCRICELKVPSSLRSMEEHVNGMGHQTKKNPEVPEEITEKIALEEIQERKVKNVQEDPEFVTVSFEDFCEEVTTFRNFYQHLAIINTKFCISIFSFMMITKNGDRMQCQVCDYGLTMSNINDHIKTRRHEQAIKGAPVLIGLADEFVREVRAGAYHCGFCSLVVSGRAALRLHLASDAHRRERTQAEWALEEHLPTIEEHRMERQRRMEFILLMRLLCL